MNRTDEQLAALTWLRDWRESNNDWTVGLLADTHRFLVMKGGAGSGKSIFAGRKLLERIFTERGNKFLATRKTAKELEGSCWAQMLGQLEEHYPDEPVKINGTLKSITSLRTGSQIVMSGLDDVRKLKSIYGLTGAWIEEADEVTLSDFLEINRRIRGQSENYQQIILTFNPTSSKSWLKLTFWDKPPELMREGIRTYENVYTDNRFLTDEDRAQLEMLRDISPYDYEVYTLGQWGVVGNTVFDKVAVSERIKNAPEPVAVGYYEYDVQSDDVHISNARWVDDPNGSIRVYKRPEKGKRYAIGGDTAGYGSDFFTGQALDAASGEQVAVLKQAMDEDLYARQMYCLGNDYNEAIVGIETNFSTYPVQILQKMGYSHQFVREREDVYTGAYVKSYGFVTSSKSRNRIIANLVQLVREHSELFNDLETLDEMLTFVRNEKGRAEAVAGAHDDLVMAAAIAYDVRRQVRGGAANSPDISKLDKDLQRFYYNAKPEERQNLLKKWGVAQ
ncbi:MAG: PBSX family phage terminase large subunit [Oscillospiraceae bacterium]|jgi:phage terminase large subunit|nr:PBSX family phage terminase large subunit [Oscillospiraceae bacterium]